MYGGGGDAQTSQFLSVAVCLCLYLSRSVYVRLYLSLCMAVSICPCLSLRSAQVSLFFPTLGLPLYSATVFLSLSLCLCPCYTLSRSFILSHCHSLLNCRFRLCLTLSLYVSAFFSLYAALTL